MWKGIRYKVGRDTLRMLYKLIRPAMEYGDVLWDGCTDGESLESVQYEARKVIN